MEMFSVAAMPCSVLDKDPETNCTIWSRNFTQDISIVARDEDRHQAVKEFAM